MAVRKLHYMQDNFILIIWQKRICAILSIVHLSFGNFLSPSPCNFGNWDWEPLRWHKYRASWGLPLPLHGESMTEQGSQYRRNGIPRIKRCRFCSSWSFLARIWVFILRVMGSHETTDEINQETSMVIYLQMPNITLTIVWTIVWRGNSTCVKSISEVIIDIQARNQGFSSCESSLTNMKPYNDFNPRYYVLYW